MSIEKKPEIVPFKIERKLEDIPETEEVMPFCGHVGNRVNIVFQHPFDQYGKYMVAICEEVPGYRCDCGIETFGDRETVAQVLVSAIKTVQPFGDNQAITRLSSSLEANFGKKVAEERLKGII